MEVQTIAGDAIITKEPSVFRQSLPVILPSFINNCGKIGLDLLPMLIVARGLSVRDSSLVMTSVKVSMYFGTMFGGWSTDRLGMKASILISFFVSALALGVLPFTDGVLWLIAAGVVAQIANSMFKSPSRLLLTEGVKPAHRQEAIGWFRTANNMGQIVSYGVGYLASSLGLPALFLFDSFTSVVAGVYGIKGIQEPEHLKKKNKTAKAATGRKTSGYSLFIVAALVFGGFSFLYDIYSISTSARCELLFGHDGLRVFSKIMLLNTVIVSLLAVYAARHLRNPKWALPTGVFLVSAGTYLSLISGTNRWYLFAGAFVLTGGELLFTALATYIQIHLLPSSKNQGSIYSVSLLVQRSGKILAGALAFPLVIHGASPLMFVAISFGVVMVLTLYLVSQLKAAHMGEE